MPTQKNKASGMIVKNSWPVTCIVCKKRIRIGDYMRKPSKCFENQKQRRKPKLNLYG